MRAFVLLALTSIVAAGCAGSGEPTTAEPQHPSTAVSPSASPHSPEGEAGSGSPEVDGRRSASKSARPARKVKVAQSEFGRMLFDASGQAIYLFDKERTSAPECYGACAKAWPPVLTQGRPQGVGAVRSQLLGTTPRKDGSAQVIYDGHPLYYYAHEDKNEVLCHNVAEFGGLWLVVTPSGEPAA